MRVALLGFLVLAGSAGACSRAVDGPTAASSAATRLAATPASGGTSAKTQATVLDFVAGFDACTLSHRGVLLDLGDATMRARMSGTKLQSPDVEVREHQGASWANLHERSLDLTFVSPIEVKSEGGIVIEARVRGGAAKTASVYLNGKPIGALQLAKDEARVVSAHSATASIAAGNNDLRLRLVGGTRTTRDNLAEIDWIRVGPADGDAPYAAPTRSDALTTVSIGGLARRGISLRAPGSIRCGGFVPSGAVLEGQIGVSGGEAEAEVRVLVDRAEPRVVGSFRLGGEGAPAWTPISLPLGDAGTLAAVELVAKSSTKGARLVFAEPRVVPGQPTDPVKVPRATGVILVVLGSTSAKSLSPYGSAIANLELAQLATAGTVFESHRAVTSFASGALASMLTGLPPRVHGVSDSEAMLVAGSITIAEAARQAGVVTGMFTANPTTSAAYGFARGWETFSVHAPNEEGPATAVFDDVERWLDAHKADRFLAVVHARGGHPPWDVGGDEKELAPPGYTGSLDAKHAGEMLAKVRRSPVPKLFTDADRQRAFALHDRAVSTHDAALGKLVAKVRQLGREHDTTFIVTADVGVDAAAHAPFLEDDALDESTLSIPMVVRAPGTPVRPRVASATSSIDVARTVLETLGLAPPPQMRGESLWSVAQRSGGRAEPIDRARIATTTTRFAARWSAFALTGVREREATLCNLSLEAECVNDVRATHPLAAEMMHALVFDELASPRDPKQTVVVPTHPVPDAATSAALRAWGTGAHSPGTAGTH